MAGAWVVGVSACAVSKAPPDPPAVSPTPSGVFPTPSPCSVVSGTDSVTGGTVSVGAAGSVGAGAVDGSVGRASAPAGMDASTGRNWSSAV